MARLQVPRLLVFVGCLQAAAHAQEAPNARTGSTQEEQARARFTTGLTHFNLGEYEAAIADFQAGYRAKPLPLFLFNIAQAARAAGKAKFAIENYRHYIDAETLPNAPELAVAQHELHELLVNTPDPATPDPATNEPTPAARPPLAPAEAPNSITQTASPPVERAAARRSRRKLIWGLAAGTVALIAIGVTVGVVVGTWPADPTPSMGRTVAFP